MTFFSSSLMTFSTPSISYRASYSGRRYGSTFWVRSPGRKPSFSPASTAGRTSTRRCTRASFSASTAIATARKVLPVPAGPIPKLMSCVAIACRYFAWLAPRARRVPRLTRMVTSCGSMSLAAISSASYSVSCRWMSGSVSVVSAASFHSWRSNRSVLLTAVSEPSTRNTFPRLAISTPRRSSIMRRWLSNGPLRLARRSVSAGSRANSETVREGIWGSSKGTLGGSSESLRLWGLFRKVDAWGGKGDWSMRDIRILLALLFVSHVSVAGTLPVTVVSAARIHTMDHEQPHAQAMAYDGDGRILALGGTAELLARYPGAKRIEAGNATVIPGLIDAHGHVEGLGLTKLQVDLRGTRDKQDILQRLRDFARELPPQAWLLGRDAPAEAGPGRRVAARRRPHRARCAGARHRRLHRQRAGSGRCRNAAAGRGHRNARARTGHAGSGLPRADRSARRRDSVNPIAALHPARRCRKAAASHHRDGRCRRCGAGQALPRWPVRASRRAIEDAHGQALHGRRAGQSRRGLAAGLQRRPRQPRPAAYPARCAGEDRGKSEALRRAGGNACHWRSRQSRGAGCLCA